MAQTTKRWVIPDGTFLKIRMTKNVMQKKIKPAAKPQPVGLWERLLSKIKLPCAKANK